MAASFDKGNVERRGWLMDGHDQLGLRDERAVARSVDSTILPNRRASYLCRLAYCCAAKIMLARVP